VRSVRAQRMRVRLSGKNKRKKKQNDTKGNKQLSTKPSTKRHQARNQARNDTNLGVGFRKTKHERKQSTKERKRITPLGACNVTVGNAGGKLIVLGRRTCSEP
jgi:hypothetical protein